MGLGITIQGSAGRTSGALLGDVLHPGRPWANKLGSNPRTPTELGKAIEEFLKSQLQDE